MDSSVKTSFLGPIDHEKEKIELKNMDLRERVGARPDRAKKVAAPPERKPTKDINESAEAFIRKFRQQLALQRLESIENFEQMLKRGT
ncbi:hypothetical protein PHJA_001695000 [Phtheirospermum japonicum]|uniref:Uncharacterized protein n=1 Tax=Phtheirospermum japonicum TaxID=374723 RepID=A0A830C451_9LAMI|nr:hypothetical protein PHJA_001695000 [Phtheirospermum japonicum]